MGKDLDALTLLVDGLRLRARLTYWGGVCGDWLMDHNSDTAIWFHLLSKGEGWVHAPAWQPALRLEEGDLIVFLPHAPRHVISYSPSEIPTDFSNVRATSVDEGETGFVCGFIELGMPRSSLWTTLFAEILIRKAQAGEILSWLLQLIIKESITPRFGTNSIIERLCDSIFVLVLRHCIEENLVHQGVFAAMQDHRIEPALTRIHREPGRPWTLESLCSLAGLSKTAFSNRFTELVGCPPIEYVATWRMQTAAGLLRETGMTIDDVAERCGYRSVSAFSKNFKRTFGVAPGSFRVARPHDCMAQERESTERRNSA